LLLSRSTVRSREIAVRLAIGAGRIPLVRQLLIENLLLAIGGGGVGLWLAYGAVQLWNSLPLGTDLPFQFNIQVDRRVLLFTAGVSIVSTLLFGLAPALRATRLDLGGA
jgi:ABC-type antimicrobial peptide transport system permease subunit